MTAAPVSAESVTPTLTTGMDYFRQSAGQWRSQRVTHHLAFRRTELGESVITVEILAAADPRVADICQMHDVAADRAAGGALVTWQSTMDWDKNDEDNHEGKTVMVIVPNDDSDRSGQLLRERGYAEIMPVAGQYEIDDDGGMVLSTEYETMSSIERFWFPNGNLRMRTSTLKRFGGFNTATFCTEVRAGSEAEAVATIAQSEPVLSVLGW